MGHRPQRRHRHFNLKSAMFILPNLFTVSSIFCGFYAAILAAGAAAGGDPRDLYRACIAVLFAMVFDAVDGRVARLTRTQSEFGVQMDSLADVISFGVTPALIAWHWGLSSFGSAGLIACFVYCACGAIRLARFNVMAARESGPSQYFMGVPIPAAAGTLVATVIAHVQSGRGQLEGDEAWAPALMLGLGTLMVSNIRFRTFKASRPSRKAIALIMLVIASAAAIAVRFRPSFAIVALLSSYLLFGLVENAVHLVRRLAAASTEDDGDLFDALDELDEVLELESTAPRSPGEDPRSSDDEEELLE